MKYSWTGRPPDCKLVRLSMEVQDGIIRGITVNGDFFAHPEEAFDELEARLTGTPVERIAETAREFCKESRLEMYGLSPEGIAWAAGRAMDDLQVS